MNKNVIKYLYIISSLLVLVVILIGVVYFTERGKAQEGPFDPNEKLNPTCLPTDAGCYVKGTPFVDVEGVLRATTSNLGKDFEVNGLTALDNGNVGIGTSTPNEKLYIENNADSSTQIFVNNSNTGGLADASLTVNSGIPFFLGSTRGSLTAYSLSQLTPFGGNVGLYSSTLSNLLLGAGLDIVFYTGGIAASTERMRIKDPNGNVGIGTSEPNGRLDIRGGLGGSFLNGTIPNLLRIVSIPDAELAITFEQDSLTNLQIFGFGFDENGEFSLGGAVNSLTTPVSIIRAKIVNEEGPDKGLVTINDVLRLNPRTNPPTSPESGTLYVNSDGNNELCFWDGLGWQGISSGTDANCSPP